MNAYKSDLINEDKGNQIWLDMLNANRKLPYSSFSKSIKKN